MHESWMAREQQLCDVRCDSEADSDMRYDDMNTVENPEHAHIAINHPHNSTIPVPISSSNLNDRPRWTLFLTSTLTIFEQSSISNPTTVSPVHSCMKFHIPPFILLKKNN